MANTYTCLHVQLIFAVSGRENLIHENNRVSVQKYMATIAQSLKATVLAVYCNPDHVHILVGIKPDIPIATIAKTIKGSTSKWINKEKWFPQPFRWQRGYGAFCYSKSHVPKVIRYILNQKEHHSKSSFKEEYITLLRARGIDYDERYLFEWIKE
ncbi:MAG: IS200/IS605 family transposase [Bacteroidota bacterium]